MEHNDLIKSQFNKQAATFGNMPGHYDALNVILQMTQASNKDVVLDVACGPGIVAAAFAPVVKSVTGIDLAPSMIERAKRMQEEKNLANMSWKIGSVTPLPYDTASFSICVTRFSFHHFIDPLAVLKEMDRVTRWGGRVAVVDVYVTNSKQSIIYDQMEKLRDPSHTRAVFLDELEGFFNEVGLNHVQKQFYRLEVDVEDLLKATFTPPEEAEQFRQIVTKDIGHDLIGISASIKEGRLIFYFPVVVMVGEKQANERYGISCCAH